MTRDQAIELICCELSIAEGKFPKWPTDPIHAAAVLVEEAGETVQASIDACYKNKDYLHEAEIEAAQAGAMAIRFLMGMGKYVCKSGEQK